MAVLLLRHILIKDDACRRGSELSILVRRKLLMSEKVVMPGLIDAHCHLGIWEKFIRRRRRH